MRIAKYCTLDVKTITRGATILEAARRMRDEHVGCLVVVDEEGGKVVGIITDRDLTIRVLAGAESLREGLVESAMSDGVVSVNMADRVESAVAKMRTNGVRRVPVLDESGCAAGILTLDDVLETLSLSLADVGAEAVSKRMHAHRSHLTEEKDEMVAVFAELREKLAHAKWQAQETIFEEVDELKHLFERALRSIT